MKLTEERLEIAMEMLEGCAPEGFEEVAMRAFGPGTAWDRHNDVVCECGWCCECQDHDCMPFAPPLLIALAELYFRMKGWSMTPWPLESAYLEGLPF